MNPSKESELAKAKDKKKPHLPSPEQDKWKEDTEKTLKSKKRHPLKLQTPEQDNGKPFELVCHDQTLIDCQLFEATGFSDRDAAIEVMNQVVNVSPKPTADKASAALAMIDGIAPASPLEGLLAAQMTACHNMAMEFSRRAITDGQKTELVDINLNRATKLMRTFTAQVEALQKLRNKGQQKITVQHVQVGHGGQAIIGDVHKGGGGNRE